jgi:hypothetical protein
MLKLKLKLMIGMMMEFEGVDDGDNGIDDVVNGVDDSADGVYDRDNGKYDDGVDKGG